MARRLGLVDGAWLLIESRERPMHVGGLQLFTRPPDADDDWLQQVVVDAMAGHEPRRPFNLQLTRPYGRLGQFAVEEVDVELEYHVRHVALPRPGRIRELLSFCSNVHSQTLDRHRPLWELYLIEGIEGDRVAVFTKVHHSLLDGVAAMQQVVQSFTQDPDDRSLPPPWALRTPPREARVTGDVSTGFNPLEALGDAAGAITGLISGVGAALGAGRALGGQFIASRRNAAEVVPFQAPRTIINQRLTSTRRFVAQDYSFDRIRAVGKATGTTVNDVVLAMCAGALRTYLQSHDALPDDPLIAMVPVNVRPADDEGGEGNAISFAMANLGTNLAEPEQRLAMVNDSMNAAKARMRDMTKAELIDYAIAITAPLVLGNLTGMSGRFAPLFNVTISNVPGPRETLYWNGAELQGLYPASLLQDGYGLNITQTSYRDQMAFGITADRTALPSVQRLIDHLEEELVALEKSAG